jgi:hypothetical protein
MILKTKKDEDTGDIFIDLEDLVDYFEDISIIESCEIVELEDNSVSLTFFDKDGNIIKPKELS